MDIKQARAKLADVNRSTGIRHPKVLIGELCAVIKYLLDEIDIIKSPPISSFSKRPTDSSTKISPLPPLGPPHKSPPIDDPVRRFRKGNAGDAE